MPRPSADATFLSIAAVLARRSTCARAQVGAIIVSSDYLQIRGLGYNGAPRGEPNACISDVAGHCGCIHAELNAILKASGTESGMTMYTTTAPCIACARLILNTGIVRVVYAQSYRLEAGIVLLHRHGVIVEHLQP